MDDLTASFSKVEYLTIFGTFVYGYVSTRFFYGWGSMISRRKSARFGIDHILWTLVLFFLLIDVWWNSWLKSNALAVSKLHFIVSLGSPLVLYVFTVVLFPSWYSGQFDFKNYFEKVRPRKYLLFVVLSVTFILNDYFLERSPMIDYLFNGCVIFVALMGYFIRRRLLDRIILGIALTLLIVHLATRDSYGLYTSTDNFSLIEYLTIFLGFIFGIVAASFLEGWAALLQRASFKYWNKEHLLWSLFAFGLLIDSWWDQWTRERAMVGDVWTFMVCLVGPVLFYFLGIVFFPYSDQETKVDVDRHFAGNKKIIFILIGLILAANGSISIALDREPLTSFTNQMRIIGIVLAAIAVVFSRPVVHRLILGLAWAMLVTHLVFH